jgi:hypothetical protein
MMSINIGSCQICGGNLPIIAAITVSREMRQSMALNINA